MTTQSTYLSRRLVIEKRAQRIHFFPENWPHGYEGAFAVTNPGVFQPGTYRVDFNPKTRTATITEVAS